MSKEKNILSLLTRIEEGNATVADAQAAADWSLNELTRAEVEQLDDFYRFRDIVLPDALEHGAYLPSLLQKVLAVDRSPVSTEDLKPGEAIDLTSATRAHRVHFLRTSWFRYAAVLLLIAGVTAFLYLRHSGLQKQLAIKQALERPDISPGRNKAVLSLADGRDIVLDSAQGDVMKLGSLIAVNQGGKLKYEGVGMAAEYNTVYTPKGGQYQVVLPDGSKVWLNAASSIRFPTAFIKERRVAVTGEVYFEIAPDRNKPFYVQAGAEQIEVLGTSFNVNAYNDEPAIQTSLVTGSVNVAGCILKPGQAAQNGKIVPVNMNQVLAWKNGMFNFQNSDLRSVMKQLERWYDVEVKYEGKLPDFEFSGEMDRGVMLSAILRFLSDYGVKTRLEGKVLIIEG